MKTPSTKDTIGCAEECTQPDVPDFSVIHKLKLPEGFRLTTEGELIKEYGKFLTEEEFAYINGRRHK